MYQLGKYFNTDHIKFIDDNNASFGSFGRQMNVEIQKKDENFTLFTLRKLRVEVKYSYKSNPDGDILKKSWHLVYWVNNSYWSFPLRYYLRRFYLSYKNRHNLRQWDAELLSEHGFNADSLNKDWSHRVTHRLMRVWTRVAHPFLYRKVTKLLKNS